MEGWSTVYDERAKKARREEEQKMVRPKKSSNEQTYQTRPG